jgi:hypothetical protein
MKQNSKAGATNTGSKNPFDYFADNQRLFDLDYAEKSGELQSNLATHLARHKRVIRLFRCFCCNRNCTAQKMSNCLAVCRDCYNAAQGKGATAKRNFVEKTLNNLHKFLRRRVSL